MARSVYRKPIAERSAPTDSFIQSLVQHVDDFAIVGLDAAGKVTSWNDGARKLLGYQPEEVLGTHFARFFTPEDVRSGRPERELRRARTIGRVTGTAQVVRKDGSRFWARKMTMPVCDDGGNLLGFGTIVYDVTHERMLVDERTRLLKQSRADRTAADAAREQVTRILDSITDAFFAFDPDWHFTYVNRRAIELLGDLLGHPPGPLIGKCLWEEYPRMVGTIFDSEYRRAVQERVSVDFEYCHPPVGIWLEVRAYPSPDGLVVYLRDITERKRTEQERERLLVALETEHANLQAIIDGAPHGIFVVDRDARRIILNRAGVEIVGDRPDHTRGAEQYIGRILSPGGSALTADEMPARRALRGETVQGEELLVVRSDGRRIPIRASAAPVRTPRGEISAAIVTFEDISPQKELERLREEWTSVVAHDLRQPVTVIVGYASMLARELERFPAPVQTRIQHILTSAHQINRMVADLLDVSRIESRRLPLDCQPTNLPDLVRAVVERATLVMRGHTVRVDIADEVPLLVVDPGRIEQVLNNLLSNATKYSYPQSAIVVAVTRHGDEVEIAVTNWGHGIAPDELPRLFTRFHRTRWAQEQQIGGLGLGLYLARGIVEAHGGRIWAESIPEQTTTFHFTLPVLHERAKQ